MPKNREAKPDEYFRSQIRHLKKENAQLRRKIHELENRLAIVPEAELVMEEADYDTKCEPCTECGKGILIEITVVGRKFSHCDNCSYRTKAVKV